MDIGKTLLNLRAEPVPGYKFQVFINNIRMGFSRVTNLEESIETEPLQEGGVNDRTYSLRAPVTAERTLILERGVASRGLLMTALTLRFTVGQRLPMDVFILICDRNGVLNRMYQVHGATVKKCAVSDLDASRSEALIERFELSYETMESCPIAAGVAGGLQGALGVDIF